MHDADACARLEQTLRLSRGMALGALALVLCALVARIATRFRRAPRADS